MKIPENYSLLSPVTETGFSRAMVYYKLRLARGGLYIFLQEDHETPKSLTSDVDAVILDLIAMGVGNILKATILFKNGELSYDGISIDPFGNVHLYPVGGDSEEQTIENYLQRHGPTFGTVPISR
jgi:hypothetical protein